MEPGRKQASRLARPAARYWKGKAPKGVAEVDSDSEDEGVQQPLGENGDVPIAGDQEIVYEEDEEDGGTLLREETRTKITSMNVTLKDVNISKDGKVIVAGREESGRTVLEQEEGSFYGCSQDERLETESELVESEEESEEEAPRVPRLDGKADAESDEVGAFTSSFLLAAHMWLMLM